MTEKLRDHAFERADQADHRPERAEHGQHADLPLHIDRFRVGVAVHHFAGLGQAAGQFGDAHADQPRIERVALAGVVVQALIVAACQQRSRTGRLPPGASPRSCAAR